MHHKICLKVRIKQGERKTNNNHEVFPKHCEFNREGSHLFAAGQKFCKTGPTMLSTQLLVDMSCASEPQGTTNSNYELLCGVPRKRKQIVVLALLLP